MFSSYDLPIPFRKKTTLHCPSCSLEIVMKNLGHQKIKMVKMENESNLHATFSKRCTSILKKTSEIITLCGVELGLVVLSPAQMVYSFGHPSVDIQLSIMTSVAMHQ